MEFIFRNIFHNNNKKNLVKYDKKVTNWLFEQKNIDFQNYLKKCNLEENFKTEVICKTLNQYQHIFEYDLEEERTKIVVMDNIMRGAAVQIKIFQKEILLTYFLKSPIVYKQYSLLLLEFLNKYNINNYYIKDLSFDLTIKNIFYEFDLKSFKKCLINHFDLFDGNSLSLLYSQINYNSFYQEIKKIYGYYFWECKIRPSDIISDINELDYFSVKQLYYINNVQKYAPPSLKTYLLKLTDYNLWETLMINIKTHNHNIEFKTYWKDVSKESLLNMVSFEKFLLEYDKNLFLMWQKIKKNSDFTNEEQLNYIIANIQINKVSLNYTIAIACLDINILISPQKEYWIISKLYYYNILDILSKETLTSDQIMSLNENDKMKILLTWKKSKN